MATYAGHTYTNGCVPAAVLAPLDGSPGADLRADAAAAWNRARADVQRRTGIVLTVRGWNRTLAEQVKFFHAAYQPQQAGGTDARWYQGVRYVRRPGKAAAAIPGTSNHGWGLAVDVTDFGAIGQFDYPRRNKAFPILAEHGWTDTEGRRADTNEPWHLVYSASHDQHRNDPATPAPTPAPAPAPAPDPIRDEDLMAAPDLLFVKDPKAKEVWLVRPSDGKRRHVTSGEWAGWKARGAKVTSLSAAQIKTIPEAS